MIALRVRINNEEPVTAGANDLAVLSASISSLRMISSSPDSKPSQLFDCRLGGLTSRPAGIDNEHLTWLKRLDLKAGDTVTVEIVEVDHTSTVIGSNISNNKKKPSPEGLKSPFSFASADTTKQ